MSSPRREAVQPGDPRRGATRRPPDPPVGDGAAGPCRVISGRRLAIHYDVPSGRAVAVAAGQDPGRDSAAEAQAPAGSPPAPGPLHRLTLHLAAVCNLRCRYCHETHGVHGRPGGLMPLDLAIQAIEAARQVYGGVRSLLLFGGEPFLNPGAVEGVCRWARENMPDVTLIGAVSNMTTDPGFMAEMVERYRLWVTASVDPPAGVHDRQRLFPDGSGTFSVVDENIRRLKSATGEPRAVECTYTALHRRLGITAADISRMVRERYGADTRVSVVPARYSVDPRLRARRPRERAARSYQPAFRRLIDGKASLDDCHSALAVASELFWRPKPRLRFCNAGTDRFSVSAGGEVFPCQMFLGDRRFSMGGATPETFERVAAQGLGDALMPQNLKENVARCRRCWLRATCVSCPGVALLLTGRPAAAETVDCGRSRRRYLQVLAGVADLTLDEYTTVFRMHNRLQP